MSRVFLVPPAAHGDEYDHLMADFEIVWRSAHGERPGCHVLAQVPEEADIVLFVGSRDPLHRDVRQHPIANRFPAKTILYDSSDRVIPFLRGIYPSIELRRHQPKRTCSGFYLRYSDADTIRFTDPERTPTLLYGFVGSSQTHPIRRRVLQLERRGALLRDTSTEPGGGYGQPQQVYDAFKAAYAADLAAVRFVLCPRGVGTSTMRIFETMKAGRVPVIISDQWVEPQGPQWDVFSLRIAERDLESVPARLDEVADRAPGMGLAARAAWEKWFSPDAAFQTLSGLAASICQESWRAERFARQAVCLELLRWHTLRHHVLGPGARRLRAALGRWGVGGARSHKNI